MRANNARADVLTSFIVDTTGMVDPSSIEVMRSSDPRAAEAVRSSLLVLQFRPATAAGYKVRQRVIQPIRFQPPPMCAPRNDSPVCPRRYSNE